MWAPIGTVACLAAGLAALEAAAAAAASRGSSSLHLLHTTTNVLRDQRKNNPSIIANNSNNNNNNNNLEQQRHLSTATTLTTTTTTITNNPYYENTYDPWWTLVDETDERDETDNPKNARPATEIESLSRDLPWGSINILVLTDVHSWIAGGNHRRDDPRHWPYDGHRQPYQDADYGDVLSFYQRLRAIVKEHNQFHDNNNNNKRDLFFVMNGDFVDGTGFSGVPPTHLFPLLQHMPWDAVNVGNHELYHDETIDYLVEQQQMQQQKNNTNDANGSFTSRWKEGAYLSSNTVLTTTTTNEQQQQQQQQPLAGNKYTYLEGTHTNTTILAFGFLYDFHESGERSSTTSVRDAIREEWFLTVLGGEQQTRSFDAILVLAHMDCLDPLVTVLLDGIRSALPPHAKNTMPIQFVTGHTHRRCHARLDGNAESFEAGRFLDTIGFVSLDVNNASAGNNNNNNDDDDDDDDDEIVIETETFQDHGGNDNGNGNGNSRNNHNFQHRFLEPTLQSLHETLVLAQQESDGFNNEHTTTTTTSSIGSTDDGYGFGTPDGKALSRAIRETQIELGLDEVLGCSPQTYGIFEEPKHGYRRSTTTTSVAGTNQNRLSLWHLYLQELLPNHLLAPIYHSFDDSNSNSNSNSEPVFVSGTGILRYSLFEGLVTVNDVIAISPFNDTVHEVVAFDDTDTEKELLPIYGWQLLGLLEAANKLYAKAGEYGLPTFVLSTLPPTTEGRTEPTIPSESVIDPNKLYRIFCTDYDAARLLSVLAVLKKDETIDDYSSPTVPSITRGRTFQSQPAYPGTTNSNSNSNSNSKNKKSLIYLIELWKEYIREQMPCGNSSEHDPPSGGNKISSSSSSNSNDHHSLRYHHDFDFDDSTTLISSAQIFRPSSVTSAKVHSRMTPAQEESVLASDQKAAAILVVVAIAMVVYLFIYPPEQQPQTQIESRNYSSSRKKHPAGRERPNNDSSHCLDHETEEGDAVSLQLIPLRRYNTGNLSEGSYGSI